MMLILLLSFLKLVENLCEMFESDMLNTFHCYHKNTGNNLRNQLLNAKCISAFIDSTWCIQKLSNITHCKTHKQMHDA